MLSIGYTTLYGMLDFPNFAFAEFSVVGAYLAFLLNVTVGLPVYLSILIAAALAGLIGVFADRAIFMQMRRVDRLTLMITSLGLAIMIRNMIRFIWGPRPRSFDIGLMKPYHIFGARITPIQVVTLIVAASLMILLYILLYRTKLGKAMRAVRDNMRLAQASGISSEKVIMWVWFIGVAVATVAGSMIGLDSQLFPYMGFSITIFIFSATILGGLGHPIGAVVGSLILGFAQNFGLWIDWGNIINLGGLFNFVGSLKIPTGYKEAIPFLVLIIVFLWFPGGIFGRKGGKYGGSS